MLSRKILNIARPDPSLQNTLSKELGISKILAQILINRGMATVPLAKEFLSQGEDRLLDPFSFSQMSKAVNIVRKAVADKSSALVCGDYDVDGVTSTVLLKETLSGLGLKVTHYLPHRVNDGYGLNKKVIEIVKQKGIRLVVTADCGINNHEFIKELRQVRAEVIVTDHHEPQESGYALASAVINPKTKDSGYSFRDLAGVGVAFKFCQALTGENIFEDLDLVALGTIADIVPLLGENRSIVKRGLLRFNQTKRSGLKALMKVSRIHDKKITPEFISFILGPRINASGRVDSAETAFDLLTCRQEEEAGRLASLMDAHNRQRQKIEGRILEEAQDLIGKEINFKEHKIIVVAKEDWHQGVLGVVASKLADRFYRPTILISKGSQLCRGSGRSVKNFHLFHALTQCRQFLDNFGGHQHAAGLVIRPDNIEDFRNSINRLACEQMSVEDLLPSLEVDMETGLSSLNETLAAELNLLEPYGCANPVPLFYTRGLTVKGQPQVLSRDTLKFWVSDGQVTYPVIGFGMGGFRGSLLSCGCLDLVYALRLDTWQGQESLILEAEDIFFKER